VLKDGWLSFEVERNEHGVTTKHEIRAKPFRLEGGFRLLVGRDMAERAAFQQVIAKTLALALVITMILGVSGALYLSRKLLERVEAVAETSRTILRGDFTRRVPLAGSGDEFGILHGIEAAYGVGFLNQSGGSGWTSTDDITPAFADGSCGGGGGIGTIQGQVTSTQSGNPPLPGATVTCTCSGTNATTDGSGDYAFNNVPVGSYSMTFSDTGYVTQTLNNVLVTSGNTTTENVVLAPPGGPPAVVQDVATGAQAVGTSFTVSTGATTAGDLLAVSTEFDAGSGHASGAVTGVTDNMHDVWTQATGVTPTSRIGAAVWYTPGAAAGVTSVTVTYSTSVNPVVRFYEISNASTIDRATSASGTSAGPNSGTTGTTTSANEVVIGDIGFVTTTASISGITSGFATDALLRDPDSNHQNSEQGGHEGVSSTGSFSFSGILSSSQVWAAVIATFK